MVLEIKDFVEKQLITKADGSPGVKSTKFPFIHCSWCQQPTKYYCTVPGTGAGFLAKPYCTFRCVGQAYKTWMLNVKAKPETVSAVQRAITMYCKQDEYEGPIELPAWLEVDGSTEVSKPGSLFREVEHPKKRKQVKANTALAPGIRAGRSTAPPFIEPRDYATLYPVQEGIHVQPFDAPRSICWDVMAEKVGPWVECFILKDTVVVNNKDPNSITNKRAIELLQCQLPLSGNVLVFRRQAHKEQPKDTRSFMEEAFGGGVSVIPDGPPIPVPGTSAEAEAEAAGAPPPKKPKTGEGPEAPAAAAEEEEDPNVTIE